MRRKIGECSCPHPLSLHHDAERNLLPLWSYSSVLAKRRLWRRSPPSTAYLTTVRREANAGRSWLPRSSRSGGIDGPPPRAHPWVKVLCGVQTTPPGVVRIARNKWSPGTRSSSARTLNRPSSRASPPRIARRLFPRRPRLPFTSGLRAGPRESGGHFQPPVKPVSNPLSN
jgi:hypothetical protein